MKRTNQGKIEYLNTCLTNLKYLDPDDDTGWQEHYLVQRFWHSPSQLDKQELFLLKLLLQSCLRICYRTRYKQLCIDEPLLSDEGNT